MSARISPPTLRALLEHWAERSPGAVAVEDPAGRCVSYRELDALARGIARRLRAVGVRRGDRVGVCLPKSVNSLASLLGILQAGGAYVPVDASAPPERNRTIFADCEARAILTDEPGAAALAGGEASAIPLLVFPGEGAAGIGAPWLAEAAAGADDAAPPAPEDLAYILYTSGSTGRPKGVVHTHASAMSFVRWCAEVFQPRPDDRFSSHAPFHFDLSILDLYVPMTAGARVVLVSEATGKDPHALARTIAERGITVWYSVPSILAILAQYGRLEQQDARALRLVLFAGEVFPVKHLRRLKALWPHPVYYNLYGPTETNVCTYYRIPDAVEEERTAPYPIGAACENCETAVLDEQGRPVATGEEGILHVRAGGPVMQGYWNLPEQTARAFRTDAEGRRWYCTGDVVTCDADGKHVYVGRRDRMVKRRGYRVELGEIEAALYRHPGVREAAVVSRGVEDGVAIWAYLSAQGEPPSIIELKQFCARHLPSYMSPDRFVVLGQLPRTSTDKVDYQALLRSA
jgi:amino acid adenylation domain-containing protein